MASARNRISQALSEPIKANPILSAALFANLTRTTGGATMNAHTGEFTGVGDEGYGVGGMRSERTHRRVRTQTVPKLQGGDVSLEHVLRQQRRVARHLPNTPNANVGSWVTKSGVDFDASEVEKVRSRAMQKMDRRNEDAIFDFKPGVDIPNPKKKKRAK